MYRVDPTNFYVLLILRMKQPLSDPTHCAAPPRTEKYDDTHCVWLRFRKQRRVDEVP